jgi:hypothetical protein
LSDRKDRRVSIAGTPSRRLLFLAFCVCFAGLAIVYVVRARVRSTAGATAPAAERVAGNLDVVAGRPGLLFASAAFDQSNGFLALESMGAAAPERYRSTLRCERVHFSAGVGICLAAERRAITTYSAHTFGPDFAIRHTLPLAGAPSRTRVSPDGHRAAVTVFVSGDSYDARGFSTRTTLLDMDAGKVIADLEEFAVSKDGAPFTSIDFNFWGVTFARDSNRFYATLRTGGTNFLVEGDVNARTARVLREGVECPSISPDNTRLVYKARGTTSRWRLHVLDLATLRDVPVAETRNVDDQVEWIDNERVAYMLPAEGQNPGGGSDIWAVAVTGQAAPQILIRRAHSPTLLP